MRVSIATASIGASVSTQSEQKRRRTGDEPPPAPPTKPPSVASQCLTRTAAVGIALNAWYLLAYTGLLCTDDLRATIPYAPRFLTEQAAEKVFRAVRAVFGGENFTLADFFRRFYRFMALGILRATHEGELAFLLGRDAPDRLL